MVVVVAEFQRHSLNQAVEKGRMGKDGLGRLRTKTYKEFLWRKEKRDGERQGWMKRGK